jgi:hypothetical protein
VALEEAAAEISREQLRGFYASEEGDPLAVLERLALPAAPR